MAAVGKNLIPEYKYSLTSRDSVALVEYFALCIDIPNSKPDPC